MCVRLCVCMCVCMVGGAWKSQCHSQHPQRSSRVGVAAHSAPGVAAHCPHTKMVWWG